MNLNEQKDHFSRAVVRAVAAAAGVKAIVPEYDSDSVDILFAAPDTEAGVGARLEAQLKCSQNIAPDGEAFQYPLSVKNYDDLRWSEVYVPRILIVVHVPADPSEWLASDREKMTLKRCAYWASLAGAPDTCNVSTVNVNIMTEHVFDPAALRALLAPPGASL